MHLNLLLKQRAELDKKINKIIKQRPYILHSNIIAPIINLVARERKVDRALIVSTIRKKHIVEARQIAIALCYDIGGIPLTTIGKMFYRDHSTVIYSRNMIRNYYDTEPEFKNMYDNLLEKAKQLTIHKNPIGQHKSDTWCQNPTLSYLSIHHPYPSPESIQHLDQPDRHNNFHDGGTK